MKLSCPYCGTTSFVPDSLALGVARELRCQQCRTEIPLVLEAVEGAPTRAELFDGRYEKLGPPTDSGQGRVAPAYDRSLHTFVAIRELADPALLPRFERELELAKLLTHENIMVIYDHGQSRDVRYLTMEYLEGESLDSLLKSGELSFERALDLIIMACQGLEYVHVRGVVHRAVKPASMFVTSEGVLKLMDFGGAVSEADQSGVVTPRADVWSLGVLAYQLFTGKQPYQQLDELKAGELPAAPSTLNARVPAELDALILRALASRPEDRPADAGELCERLMALRRKHSPQPIAATAISSVRPARPGQSSPRKLVLAAAAVALLGGGALLLRGGDDASAASNDGATSAAPTPSAGAAPSAAAPARSSGATPGAPSDAVPSGATGAVAHRAANAPGASSDALAARATNSAAPSGDVAARAKNAPAVTTGALAAGATNAAAATTGAVAAGATNAPVAPSATVAPGTSSAPSSGALAAQPADAQPTAASASPATRVSAPRCPAGFEPVAGRSLQLAQPRPRAWSFAEHALPAVPLDGFCIEARPISVAAYTRCVEQGTCKPHDAACTPSSEPGAPIHCVSWEGAQQYCAARGGELPSVAQWEAYGQSASARTSSSEWAKDAFPPTVFGARCNSENPARCDGHLFRKAGRVPLVSPDGKGRLTFSWNRGASTSATGFDYVSFRCVLPAR